MTDPGKYGRILSTADESFKRMKEEIEAMKVVSQGELGAIRAAIQKLEDM